MSPASVQEERKEPSKGSQFLMILIVLLIVLAVGAAYFKLTGSLMWFGVGNTGFHIFYKVPKVCKIFIFPVN